MPRYSVLNIEPDRYCDGARDILCQYAQLVEVELGREQLLDAIGAHDVLITRLAHRIDREVLAAGGRLRAVATATTGLDHIDVEYASEHGITVLSLKGETEFLDSVTATAEHTWALLLGLIRQVPAAHGSVLDGKWDRDAHRGRDLSGKTLGIVGYGRIGRQVAKFAHAFGMNVIAYDPHVKATEPSIELVDTLEDMFRRADIVTLHLPLDEATRGLIGARELSVMVDGAVLLNTSRGAVIDERALFHALSDGRLGGAALDVLVDEQAFPSTSAQSLIEYASTHNNLILTPHIGGATAESMANTEIFIARKIGKFLESQ